MYSVTKNQSQPTKNYWLWEKTSPNATFNLFFLGLGWPWVGEFVGFIMRFTCFPTQQNWVKSQTPYYGVSGYL